MRQQLAKHDGKANVALADFVAPEGVADYIGAFVVTAGPEEKRIAEKFAANNDNYDSILVKALAGRSRKPPPNFCTRGSGASSGPTRRTKTSARKR